MQSEHRDEAAASQVTVEHLYVMIVKTTIGSAVLDRPVHNAYRIEFSGERKRSNIPSPPLKQLLAESRRLKRALTSTEGFTGI